MTLLSSTSPVAALLALNAVLAGCRADRHDGRVPENPDAEQAPGGGAAPGASSPSENPASGSTGAPAPPASGAAEYRVERAIGAYDRLVIHKTNAERGYCVSLTLVHSAPSTAPAEFAISVPPPWAVESMLAALSGCERGGEEGVARATGSVRFHPFQGSWPCALDVDVKLELAPSRALPGTETLRADSLPVPCD